MTTVKQAMSNIVAKREAKMRDDLRKAKKALKLADLVMSGSQNDLAREYAEKNV